MLFKTQSTSNFTKQLNGFVNSKKAGDNIIIPSLAIFSSIFFQSASIVLGKQGALDLKAFTLSNIIHDYFYLLSLFCLGCQAIAWQLVLRRYPLFWAYLWMSTVYIIIIIASYFIFNEPITLCNMIGSLLIICGIIAINS